MQTLALDMTDQQGSPIFCTAAPLFALARGYTTEQQTSLCQVKQFPPPFLAELTFKHVFSEAGVHAVTGLATTGKEHSPYLLKNNYYYSFLILSICSCSMKKPCLILTKNAVTLLHV